MVIHSAYQSHAFVPIPEFLITCIHRGLTRLGSTDRGTKGI